MKILPNMAGLLSVRFRVASSTALLRGVVVSQDGSVVPFAISVSSTGVDSLVTRMTPLPHGELVACECVLSAGTAYYGAATMSFGIYTTPTASSERVATLLAGAIGEASHLSYPVSPILTVPQSNLPSLSRVHSNPSAGDPVDIDLDGYGYFEIQMVSARFVTDANAANRLVKLAVGDSSGVVFEQVMANLITAGSTVDIRWSMYGSAEYIVSTYGATPLPKVGVRDGGVIQMNVDNIQAGDQFSAVRVYGVEYGSLES